MKKIIGIIVALSIVLCSFAAFANEPYDAISWSVENGILTVKGTGAMDDYKNETEAPWYDHRSEIKEIIVEDGITHIGNMAFYGLKNVSEVKIAKSVESVGIYAFCYTEGTKTSLGNPNAEFQFTIEADSAVVSKGDTFTVTVTLSGDFKDVAAVQTAVIFDKNLIAMDSKTCLDEKWLETIDETNLGYISNPMAGNVANNLRIAYVSLSGVYIDEEAPLYNAGKQELVIAKINAVALEDISDISPAILMIKNSEVTKLTEGNSVVSAISGENQLTYCTRLPIQGLTLETESKAVINYAEENNINVIGSVPADDAETDNITEETKKSDKIIIVKDGNEIASDVEPYIAQDGCVMLPLRAILENMGIAVIWDGETKTIFMATDEDFAAHQLGKKLLFKNDVTMELEHESEAKNSRTFVTADCFEKSFGLIITFDPNTNIATIK